MAGPAPGSLRARLEEAGLRTACVLGGLGRLDGIREGTVIAAIVTGKVIAWVKKPRSPVLQRVCFGAAGEEGQTVRELEELEGAGQE